MIWLVIKEIKDFVQKKNMDRKIKSGWIAHAKEFLWYPNKKSSSNRKGDVTTLAMSQRKICRLIKDAFEHFEMI